MRIKRKNAGDRHVRHEYWQGRRAIGLHRRCDSALRGDWTSERRQPRLEGSARLWLARYSSDLVSTKWAPWWAARMARRLTALLCVTSPSRTSKGSRRCGRKSRRWNGRCPRSRQHATKPALAAGLLLARSWMTSAQSAQAERGARRITAAPVMQMAAPIVSQASGRDFSTIHIQASDATI